MTRPVWLLALACCASSAPSQQRVLERAFADIQVQEARVAHTAATVADATADCATVQAATADGRAAQVALCEVAHEVRDADALIRCERAEHKMASQAATAQTRCPSANENR